MDFGVFIDAEFIVGVHVQVIPGVGLSKNQVEHFQKALHIGISKTLCVVQLLKVVVNFRNANIVHITVSEPGAQVIIPKAVLLADGLIGPV